MFQIVVLFAITDLIIWVYSEEQSDFGVEHLSTKEKLRTGEFFIRFSKIFIIPVMIRKVWKTVGHLLS